MRILLCVLFLCIFSLKASPPENCDGLLVLPVMVTPNNDGKNDVFMFATGDCLSFRAPLEVTVYNRWGVLVYEHKNYDNSWNGGKLEAGTYCYSVRYGSCSYTGCVRIFKEEQK